jgi:hypothetical protein
MAKKPGNLLIKLAVLIAVAAAVFFALDSWRKQAVKAPDAETAPADAAAPAPALSREEAERIGTEIGTRIGTEIGTQIGREVAMQMLAERKTQLEAMKKPASAAPKPAPAAEPAPSPPVETVAAEAQPEPAPAATETARPARRETHTQGTIPGSPVAQPAAGRDPWWIKSNSGEADALVLTYAGHFKSSDGSQSGIALMFSGRFDNQTDFSAISISGGVAEGAWRLGVNRGLIYLPGVASGSYTVTVKSGFRDADGKTLKTEVSGPVDVP